MKKLLLLTLLLIGNYSFSQNPYQIDKTLNDGGNGRYSFKVKGEITFGKKVFDTDKTKDAPKMHFPVFFKNFKIISITTPNGKTYSNNDLVYKTDSQYYPNGIKLPITLSNDEAQKHFKIYGDVSFNGIYTPFVKGLTNTSYAKDNEFWIDNAGFKYDIKQKIITKLENENKLKGLSRTEKNTLINTELERLFFSNNPPRINKIIIEPYVKGNKDLSNLMQLASDAETRVNTNSNESDNNSTSNTNNSSNNLETEENIARVKQSSDEIGNEVANMFQNGVTPQGFFNIGESFSNLNSNEGSVAGLASISAGTVLGIVNGLRADKDKMLQRNASILEANYALQRKEYNILEAFAKNNDHANMLETHKRLVDIEAQMMMSSIYLSKNARDKSTRPKFKNYYNEIESKIINRLRLFQELETNKLIKKIVDNNFSNDDLIKTYTLLANSEYAEATEERKISESKRWKDFYTTGVVYLSMKPLRKYVGNGFYTNYSNSLKEGRYLRLKTLEEVFENTTYNEPIQEILIKENSNLILK